MASPVLQRRGSARLGGAFGEEDGDDGDVEEEVRRGSGPGSSGGHRGSVRCRGRAPNHFWIGEGDEDGATRWAAPTKAVRRGVASGEQQGASMPDPIWIGGSRGRSGESGVGG